MSNRRRLDDRIYGDQIPRLVKRDLPFSQSRNSLNVRLEDDAAKAVKKLRREDWFHVLLRQNTTISMIGMVLAWTVAICIFAGLYLAVDKAYSDSDCGLVGLDDSRDYLNYGAYFAFSLETATTVGYGLPGSTNAFFENCGGIQALIYLQMVWSMMYNAFLFAFFFARLAKTESRGAQVIFSRTAILARNTDRGVGGPWMFEVRVFDVDAAHPVVEAHVRLYAKVGGQMVEMRMLSPNDVIGANLFLSWPAVVQHEVDVHSPLYPPQRHRDPFRLPNAGLNLRHAESVVGDVEQYACPVCGEPYGDMDRVRRHVEYYKLIEENDKVPIVGSHRELDMDYIIAPEDPTFKEMKAWFPDEVICVVEGIDPLASGTFQALQSYKINDITWEGNFENCIEFTATETVVDLAKFHSTVPDGDGDYIRRSCINPNTLEESVVNEIRKQL